MNTDLLEISKLQALPEELIEQILIMIPPEKILAYNIVRDGEIIREITLRNISLDRSQELRSTIRWTLEKMYEKTVKPNS